LGIRKRARLIVGLFLCLCRVLHAVTWARESWQSAIRGHHLPQLVKSSFSFNNIA